MALILDTNFVIAAEREARRGEPGRAHTFLSSHADEEFLSRLRLLVNLRVGPRPQQDSRGKS